jgi:hypothetical protein
MFVLIFLGIESKIASKTRTLEEAEEGEETKQEEDNEEGQWDPYQVVNPEEVQKAYPALGYDLKHGPLWSIVCITKAFGRIPGKLDVKHRGFFTYNYDVYNCERFFKVNGVLHWNQGEIPEKCVARGKQKDNNKPLYNVVSVTQYGNIPGKASSPVHAVFSHEGIRFTSKSFYWIC